MIIDAKHLRLGRLATVAAKKALMGEDVIIINCSDIVITGSKENVFSRYRQRRDRGTPSTGPFFPRSSSQIVKRTIRGMLPYKQARGRDAFQRVRCYNSIPSSVNEADAVSIDIAHIDKSLTSKYVTLRQISQFLGGKSE